jgi:hypothetical protein
MIVGQDEIVGCMVLATGNDRVGRWAWTKLSGSHSKHINFIVVPRTKQESLLNIGRKTFHD